MEQAAEDKRSPLESGFSQLTPWLSAPDERSPTFFPVFSAVSIAVQKALRAHVPIAYFADSAGFANTKTAYPMLVYQASAPFRGKLRSELTYDVLNPRTLAALFRSVKQTLPELLDGAATRLRDAGLEDLAEKYSRKRPQSVIESVQRINRSRKCLYLLIRGESLLVNALLDLGGIGEAPQKLQVRTLASFERKWSYQLRRLYPGTDFTWLAPILLQTATEALLSGETQAANSGGGPLAAQSVEPEPRGLEPHDPDLT